MHKGVARQVSRRVILRADLRAPGHKPVTTYTLALSGEEVQVASDRPLAPGRVYTIEISFRGLVAPVLLEGVVTEQQTRARGVGAPGTVVLGFCSRSPEERRALDALLARLDEPRVAPRESYRALVVEDNTLIREMFAYGLRKYFRQHHSGVSVDFASDGAMAWDLLTGETYDLVIVDYYLPGVGGAQLVQRVRADARIAATAIVAISVGGDVARRALLEAGADIFLDKPLTLRDLLGTLDGLISGGAP